MEKKEALRIVFYYYLEDQLARLRNVTEEEKEYFYNEDAFDEFWYDEETDSYYNKEGHFVCEEEDKYDYCFDQYFDEKMKLSSDLFQQIGGIKSRTFLGHENDTDEEYAAYVNNLSTREYAEGIQEYKDSIKDALFDSDKSLEERLDSFVSRRSEVFAVYDDEDNVVDVVDEQVADSYIDEDLYEILSCIAGENGQDYTLLEKMVCTPEFEAKWPKEIGTMLDDYTRVVGEAFGIAKVPIAELPEIMLTDYSCLLAYITMYAKGSVFKPDMDMIKFVKSYQESIDKLRGNISMDRKVSNVLEQVSTLDTKGRNNKTNPGGEGIGK